MLRLLVDTCVWLDLAKSKNGQAIIVPLRVLKHWQRLELLVPQVVLDEFERNRPTAEVRVARVADRFRELWRDLHEYADPDRLAEWLDEMTHHVPLISAMTLQNFREISELLTAGQRLEPTAADYEHVVRRALDKRAPFHLPKNSVADALLIELYRTALQRGPEDALCFVTANYEDFSGAFCGLIGLACRREMKAPSPRVVIAEIAVLERGAWPCCPQKSCSSTATSWWTT